MNDKEILTKDKNLVNKLTKLDKNVTSKNVQSTLDSINDMYNPDYLLASDKLYNLFNFHFNILSIPEAKSSIGDDSIDSSNDSDTIHSDNNQLSRLNWLDNHTDTDFVHINDINNPITTKEVHGIIKSLIKSAKSDIKFEQGMIAFYKKV